MSFREERNLVKAASYARRDAADNFVLDVVNHEDFFRNLHTIIPRVQSALKTGHYTPAPLLRVEIPKTPCSVRPGAVMSIIDMTILYSVLGYLGPPLDDKLHPNVYSYRVRAGRDDVWATPPGGDIGPYENDAEDEGSSPITSGDPRYSWFSGWLKYFRRSREAAGRYDYCAVADITAFFENIPVEALTTHIGQLLGYEYRGAVAFLRRFFDFWGWATGDAAPGEKVLPQGNDIALFLSNFCLTDFDRKIAEIAGADAGRYLRYVDDIRFFAPDRDDAQRALLVCESALRSLNFNLQTEKTRVVKSSDLFDADAELWAARMETGGAAAHDAALAFLADIPWENDITRWESVYLRALTILQREGDDAAVEIALRLFLTVPSYKLLVKNFKYLRRFAPRHSYRAALAERLTAESFTFPYHRYFLYSLGFYGREDCEPLRNLAHRDALRTDAEWYWRYAALHCLNSFPLTDKEGEDIATLAEKENHPAIARAALVALRQRPRRDVDPVYDNALFHVAPQQSILREYIDLFTPAAPLAPAVIEEIATEDISSPWFHHRLHQLDLLKDNASVRMRSRAVLETQLAACGDRWPALADRLQAISRTLARDEALESQEQGTALMSKQMETVLRTSHEAIVMLDVHGIIKVWNDGANNLFGYGPEEAVGREFGRLVAPTPVRRTGADLLRSIAERDGAWTEEAAPLLRKDGTLLFATITYSAVTGLDGVPVGILLVSHNITAQIHAARAQQFQVACERVLADASDRFISTSDIDAAITATTEDVAVLMNVSRAYVWYMSGAGPINTSFRTDRSPICTSPLSLTVNPWFYEQFSRNRLVVLTDVGSSPDIITTYMETRGVCALLAVPFFIGDVLHGAVVIMDTERPRTWEPEDINILRAVAAIIGQAVERRTESKAFLREGGAVRTFVDNSDFLVVGLNVDGEVVLVNTKMAQTLGYTEEELRGRSWFTECLHPHANAEIAALFREAVSETGEVPEEIEVSLATSGGDEKIIHMHNSLVRDNIGRVIGTLSLIKDVTGEYRDAGIQDINNRGPCLTGPRAGVALVRRDYTVAVMSPLVKQWFGEKAPAIGLKCYELFRGRPVPCPNCYVRNTIETGEPRRNILTYLGVGVDRKLYDLSSLPFRNAGANGICGVILYIRPLAANQGLEHGQTRPVRGRKDRQTDHPGTL